MWSVTSFSELARDGVAAESGAAIAARPARVRSYVGEQLAPTRGPIVAATDYVRAVPEQIRAFLPPGRRCVTLGTDGFGRSDTRAALRATSRSTPRRSSSAGAVRAPAEAALTAAGQQPLSQSWNASQSSRPSARSRMRPGSRRPEAGRAGALALDPGGEAAHVGRLVERDHQLVVEEEAAQVEVGRAGERELRRR